MQLGQEVLNKVRYYEIQHRFLIYQFKSIDLSRQGESPRNKFENSKIDPLSMKITIKKKLGSIKTTN